MLHSKQGHLIEYFISLKFLIFYTFIGFIIQLTKVLQQALYRIHNEFAELFFSVKKREFITEFAIFINFCLVKVHNSIKLECNH